MEGPVLGVLLFELGCPVALEVHRVDEEEDVQRADTIDDPIDPTLGLIPNPLVDDVLGSRIGEIQLLGRGPEIGRDGIEVSCW